MVWGLFLMQNTQNRDTAAIQLKLSANENARNAMLTLEDLTEEQLNRMKATFARLAERPGAARDKLRDAQEDHQVASERVKEAKDTITDIEAGARIGMANA